MEEADIACVLEPSKDDTIIRRVSGSPLAAANNSTIDRLLVDHGVVTIGVNDRRTTKEKVVHTNGFIVTSSHDVEPNISVALHHHRLVTEALDREEGGRRTPPAQALDDIEAATPAAEAHDVDGHPVYLSHLPKGKLDKFFCLQRVSLLFVIFFGSLGLLYALFMTFPPVLLEASVMAQATAVGPPPVLRLPRTMADLRALRAWLSQYEEVHGWEVSLGLAATYLFLQTFMIPGSIFLNILAGSLYGFYTALTLVTLLASVGASLSYLLSYAILKEIVYQMFPERIEKLCRQVHAHRSSLVNLILFLRITPIFPNWFTNVAAPIVNMPFPTFLLGTALGFIPGGVITVKAGRMLSRISSVRELYDWQTVTWLVFIGFVVLLPVFVRRRMERVRPVIVDKAT